MLSRCTFLTLFFLSSPVLAGINNPGSSSGAVNSPVGHAQENLGGNDVTAQIPINLFSVATISYNSGATPAAMDADNYPVRNFSGNISGNIGGSTSTLSTTGPWILSWPAGRSSFKINFLAPATITSIVNATVANGSGSGNPSITGDGVHAGSVVINWNTTAGLTYQWDGAYTSWAGNTTGTVALYRSSDQTAFNAGTFWSPEFVSTIRGLHPRSIRPMGWNLPQFSAVRSNEALWAYRSKTSNFSFFSGDLGNFPPGTRSGGAASFGAISVSNGAYTAAAADDTSLAGWPNGETLTGAIAGSTSPLTITGIVSNGGNCQITVASTTGLVATNPVMIDFVNGTVEAVGVHTILSVDSGTQFTINVPFVNAWTSSGQVQYATLGITGKSGGRKVIVPDNWRPGTVGTTGNVTLVYNSVLDRVCYTPTGVALQPPIEAQAQLANLVNANLWYTIPTWADDNYITNAANTAFSSLNANLSFHVELSNEIWNSAFVNFFYANQMGLALGITTYLNSGNSGSSLQFEGLRLRQIHGNLLPASSWSGSMSRLIRLYETQGGTGIGTPNLNAMKGTTLVSPGTAAYQAYVGGSAVNYDTAPNRPIDVTNSIGVAPYIAGTALSGQSPDVNKAPTVNDAAILQGIADNFSGGNIALAIAAIDDNIRQGRNLVQTVTASGTTFTTPLAHGLVVGNLLRFSVSGGTAYSGINTQVLYQVISTPLTTTFTLGAYVNGAFVNSAINAGSAGSGTMSVGFAGTSSQQNMFGVSNQSLLSLESAAASFDATRPAGMANLITEWYEGSIEPTAPSAAQCTAIGVNLAGSAADASAAIANAITAWKNDPLASLTIQAYYKAFMGTDPAFVTFGLMAHSRAPANLVLSADTGFQTYPIMSNHLFAAPTFYQLYNGFAAFSAP